MAPLVPIFLLGSARSGTTWLGNLLASHPAISGPQHPVHWGLAESRLVATARYAGDLTDSERLIQFLEIYAASDFFRLAHGDKAALYRYRPANFYDLFFELMDHMCAVEGTGFWVTKLDPAFYIRPELLRRFWQMVDLRYPVSRVVGIRREFGAVLRSYLNMEGIDSIHRLRGVKRAAALALESARHAAHDPAVAEIVAARGGVMTTYESLREAPEAALAPIGDYLGLSMAEVEPDRYPPNSSHITRAERDAASPWVEALATRALRPVFARAPAAARALLELRDRTRRERPPFYWRLLQLELMPQQLESELLATSQTGLHRALFGPGDPDDDQRSRQRFRK